MSEANNKIENPDYNTPINPGQSNLIYPQPGYIKPTFQTTRLPDGEAKVDPIKFYIIADDKQKYYLELNVKIVQYAYGNDEMKPRATVIGYENNFRMVKVYKTEVAEINRLLEYCCQKLNEEMDKDQNHSVYLKGHVLVENFDYQDVLRTCQSLDQFEGSHQD